jgi:hypothetical protein
MGSWFQVPTFSHIESIISKFEADKERNKNKAEQLTHSHCEKQWDGSSI